MAVTQKQKGIKWIKIVLMVTLLMCMSFLFIGTWFGDSITLSDTSKERNEAIYTVNTGNPHEYLKQCQKFPNDIVLFDNNTKESSFCCSTCALVSSSGMMTGSKAKKEIESNECVIRMNNAPTHGYEEDVGSKTTFRVFSHTSVVDIKNLLHSYREEENRTIFIAWGPKRNMVPGAITNNHLKEISRINQNVKMYIFTEERMACADDIFKQETGLDRMKSGSYLSTGWFTILFARDICGKINMFGFVEESFCKNMINSKLRDPPYHYYKSGTSQCSTYIRHEHAKRGGHRFITEKRIFKKWAQAWGTVNFYHPHWNLVT